MLFLLDCKHSISGLSGCLFFLLCDLVSAHIHFSWIHLVFVRFSNSLPVHVIVLVQSPSREQTEAGCEPKWEVPAFWTYCLTGLASPLDTVLFSKPTVHFPCLELVC